MPWYAIAYLVIFYLICIFGMHEDLKDEKPWHFFVMNGFTTLLISFFVIGYYSTNPLFQIGLYALPLLAIGLSWDFYTYHLDMKQVKDEEAKHEDDPIPPAIFLCIEAVMVAFLLVGYLPGFQMVMKAQ